MKDEPDEFEEITTTLTEMTVTPMLAVTVDFNALMNEHGDINALDIVAKLKDLLS